MADPNFASVWTDISLAAEVLHQIETFTSTASTGLIAATETLRNSLEGDYGQNVRDGVENLLASGATMVSRDQARAIFNPLLRQSAVATDYPDPQGGSIEDIWEWTVDYFVANSQTINDSEDTIDTTWSADGGNTGNGEVIALAVDENGNDLGWTPDSWTLECVQDARENGQTDTEVWRLYGTARRPDNLSGSDGGATGVDITGFRTLAVDLSEPYLQNASFDGATENGSSVIQTLPGWTANSGAISSSNLKINTTYIARESPSRSTGHKSLQFTGDETIYQDPVATVGATFNPNEPFILDVAVAKVGTPTGTARIRLSGTVGSGGLTATLAHTAMTGSGTFDRLRLTVGANSWPANFNANDLKVQIALESTASVDASNYFVVDDVMLCPLQRVNPTGDPRSGRGSMGYYLGVLSGSTPFIKGDKFTAAGSAGGTRGKIHWALTKIAQYGALPMATGGLETVSDQ